MPRLFLDGVTDITPGMLENLGIKTLALDVDNTLAPPKSMIPFDGVLEWIGNMQANGIALFIVSNAKKRRVEPFANSLGLSFTSLALKPFPFCFSRAAKSAGVKKKEIAMVGDQVFTDMISANTAGVYSLLVRLKVSESHWSYKFKRRFEVNVINRYHKKEKNHRKDDI